MSDSIVDEIKPDNDQTAGGRAADPLDQLRIERDGLRVERDELKEMLLRRQAEFDNYRKRTEKDRADFLQYAGMDLVKEMLPVLDDFERALKTECASPQYAKGVEMIHNRMYEILKRLGLEPIEVAEAMFDPHLHQAVERVETTGAEDGSAGRIPARIILKESCCGPRW